MTGPTACLTFPLSREFTVTEVPSGKKTIFHWTTADGLALGAHPPSEAKFSATPSTDEFIPASSLGWKVSFPGAGEASPSAKCFP